MKKDISIASIYRTLYMKISDVFIYLKTWLGDAKFYFFLSVIFFTITIICFTWQIWDTISLSLPIDTTIWGQFGDFIGGTLGSIFSLISVMLVVWTFKTQNKTSETQRFNDLFFELIKLYQEQEKELEYIVIDTYCGFPYREKYTYKDFFSLLNEKLLIIYQPTNSISRNRKEAIAKYIEITLDFKNKLSLTFKTIYQILCLIDNSNLNQKDKIEYLKIFRSQFTVSELLFLRYHIKSGEYKKFAYLVNKSNLLKHLPLFELLEFKYWRDKLNKQEIRVANSFYITLIKSIKKNEANVSSVDNLLSVIIKKDNTSLTLTFIKNKNTSWLSKFNKKEFENLCECIIKEIVLFSNYAYYNNYKELYFKHAETNKNQITVSVKNNKGNKLNLLFEDLKEHNICKIL